MEYLVIYDNIKILDVDISECDDLTSGFMGNLHDLRARFINHLSYIKENRTQNMPCFYGSNVCILKTEKEDYKLIYQYRLGDIINNTSIIYVTYIQLANCEQCCP